MRVHGHDRNGELRDAICRGQRARGRASRSNRRLCDRVRATAGTPLAETNEDLRRCCPRPRPSWDWESSFQRAIQSSCAWCLEQGLQIVQQSTLMTIGLYNEPEGAYLPSILF
jgi:hypothetical protein